MCQKLQELESLENVTPMMVAFTVDAYIFMRLLPAITTLETISSQYQCLSTPLMARQVNVAKGFPLTEDEISDTMYTIYQQEGVAALYRAVEDCNLKLLEALLEKSHESYRKQSNEKFANPLFVAVANRKIDIVKMLLKDTSLEFRKARALIDHYTIHKGDTVFHSCRDRAIMEVLLEGTPPEFREVGDKDGWTPLECNIVRMGVDVHIVATLLQGSRPEYRAMNESRSLQRTITRTLNPQILQLLLQDCSPEYIELLESSLKILHIAVYNNNAAYCEVILNAAPLDFLARTNKNGTTAIDNAKDKSVLLCLFMHQVMIDFAVFMFTIDNEGSNAKEMYWNPDEICKEVMVWLVDPMKQLSTFLSK
eukprot:TRINITY_DN430461_c0_g1_i1.p1 TRINITY_DN430461_c0_g1~~TRINITY_DN430461_c0_g1_i1.p1  ORF type:complete len:366 (-),score=52.74 TRINITY_DN430461_c0_g1_i1:79-1176(-)